MLSQHKALREGNKTAQVGEPRLSHLQANNRLEQACTVGGAGEGGVLQHLLSDLTCIAVEAKQMSIC
jgi:hypothetical protein